MDFSDRTSLKAKDKFSTSMAVATQAPSKKGKSMGLGNIYLPITVNMKAIGLRVKNTGREYSPII